MPVFDFNFLKSIYIIDTAVRSSAKRRIVAQNLLKTAVEIIRRQATHGKINFANCI
jgi:predicted GNAT family acetyltransferase